MRREQFGPAGWRRIRLELHGDVGVAACLGEGTEQEHEGEGDRQNVASRMCRIPMMAHGDVSPHEPTGEELGLSLCALIDAARWIATTAGTVGWTKRSNGSVVEEE